MPKLTKREQERALAQAVAADNNGDGASSPPSAAPTASQSHFTGRSLHLPAASHLSAQVTGASSPFDNQFSTEEIASLMADTASFDVNAGGETSTPVLPTSRAGAGGRRLGWPGPGEDAGNGVEDAKKSTVPLIMDGMGYVGNGGAEAGGFKRKAEEAFGGRGGGGGEGEGDPGANAWEELSQHPRSQAPVVNGRVRKTPVRPTVGGSKCGAGAATPGSADKSSKGLRHFSLQVCRKVEEKGRTNYNEVADELVAEVLAQRAEPSGTGPVEKYDEKNIRRRVYDALNVLMAMDIISKEKKEIRWKGLPSNAQHDLEVLRRDKRRLESSLAKKRELLQELILQRIAFQRLMRRNSEREEMMATTTSSAAAAAAAAEAAAAAANASAGTGSSARSSPSSSTATARAAAAAATAAVQAAEDEEQRRVPLPFIIVNTHSQTLIHCEMAEDRSDVFFNFSAPFELADDNEILRRMQLQRASVEDVEAFVPEHLKAYVSDSVYE